MIFENLDPGSLPVHDARLDAEIFERFHASGGDHQRKFDAIARDSIHDASDDPGYVGDDGEWSGLGFAQADAFQAAMAKQTQPAMKLNPPKGVMAPRILMSVMASA